MLKKPFVYKVTLSLSFYGILRRRFRGTPVQLYGSYYQQLPITSFPTNRRGQPYNTYLQYRDTRRREPINPSTNRPTAAPSVRNTRNARRRRTPPVLRVLSQGDLKGWLPLNNIKRVELLDLGTLTHEYTFYGTLHWLNERLVVRYCSLRLLFFFLSNRFFPVGLRGV